MRDAPRRRVGMLALAALVLVAVAAGPASADLYLPDHPNAPETTCKGRFVDGEASCTLEVIGEHFAVGGYGSTLFRVSLEAPGELGSGPGETIASCMGTTGGCVGAARYASTPWPNGTVITCRGWGIGSGTFECSSFDVP